MDCMDRLGRDCCVRPTLTMYASSTVPRARTIWAAEGFSMNNLESVRTESLRNTIPQAGARITWSACIARSQGCDSSFDPPPKFDPGIM
jgi:hypothetical protein